MAESTSSSFAAQPKADPKWINFKPATISGNQVIYASITAFFAWLFSVYDFILFGTMLPKIAAEFGWSTQFSTYLAAWVGFGTFLVALTVGPIVDYFGRKNALFITVLFAALSCGLTALTFSAVYLVLIRSLSGMGYSEQAVNTTYLSEIYGEKRRGFIYSFIQGGWPIGVMVATLIVALTLDYLGWRGTFAVAFIPAIIIFVMRFWLKETPRFSAMKYARNLMKEGKEKEAVEFGKQYGIDVGRVKHFVYRQLFESDVRKHTVFLCGAFLLNWFSCQVFLVLGTTVFTAGKGLDFKGGLWILVLSNALAYIGYVVHGYIGDQIGRRETVSIAWLLSGICYGIMCLWAESYGAVMFWYCAGLFFQIGSYSALFTYMGESYPTRIRGTGASFANAMGPVGALLGSALFSMFQSYTGVTMSAFYSGVIPLILSGFVILGARHVKPGTILEEISK